MLLHLNNIDNVLSIALCLRLAQQAPPTAASSKVYLSGCCIFFATAIAALESMFTGLCALPARNSLKRNSLNNANRIQVLLYSTIKLFESNYFFLAVDIYQTQQY